jgi:hypothetical protein
MLKVSNTLRPLGTPVREAPASVGQRLLWFLDHYRASGAECNCPVVCRLDGPLDIARLRESVGELVARHEALRTTVERRGRQLWQVVHGPRDPEFEIVDLAGEHDPEQGVLNAVKDELRRRIDPVGFPVRATLWRTAELRHIFCLNVHHLATDAWSGAIQMRDLGILYERDTDRGRPLPPTGLQYADFTARQQEYFRGEAFKRDIRYWRENLAGAAFDSIPLVAPVASRRRNTAEARISISARDKGLLMSTARNCKTTLFSLLLALYFTTLYRMTGRSDLSVASLFANRLRPDVQNTVGFIANVVLLRSVVRPGASFRAIQQTIQGDLREAFVHQACPLHLLPAEITVRNGRRADETVFQMLPQALDHGRMGDVNVTMMAPEGLESRFDFEVTVLVKQEELAVIVLWNRNCLGHEWVSEFLREYRACVAALLSNPEWFV